MVLFSSVINQKTKTYFIIPNRWQSVVELVYTLLVSLVKDNIKSKEAQLFLPLITYIFVTILLLNLIGLVPYSFTLTSHIAITFSLAFALFFGINIIGAINHGIKLITLWLPTGTALALAFLLVPIELISYTFKPISLSIRLFANMMAGHVLLKVIVGFAHSLMESSDLMFFFHLLPLIVLIPLFGLELGVAIIQAFVFSILVCIYLNESINLH